ncbi:TPA: hypothetical protein ACKRQV_000204 [Pseudomonas aeruginosa]|nr:hypothetical protein [Pseudomonas aeruginosa]EIU2862485.1 hypothetical protein [Pseudomonas aeruginosa]
MEMLQTVLISAVVSVVSIFGYDQFLAAKPTPIAVANYDKALTALKDPNEALAALRSNSSLLAAEGFVVLDARALLGYPGEIEIPTEALMHSGPAEQSLKGNPVPANAVDDLEKGDD